MSKRFIYFLGFLCINISFAPLVFAAPADSSKILSINTSEKSSKSVLDNGMTALVTEMPTSPVVAVYALVKTGSATEGRFLGTGISHFLEHMLFKGTHGRDVGEIAGRIQAVGGKINASTGMDYTIYTISVPAESFDIALDVLSDMLMNATMDPEEVERERDVILSEMRLYNDNPDRKLGEYVFRNVYTRHPYQHPIIGYPDLLEGVSRGDLVEYYHQFYAPNNIIFSVAGNVKTKEVFSKMSTRFKDFKRQRNVMRNLPQEPQQITQRRYEVKYPTDLTRLSMVFGSVRLLDSDLYALDVLAQILGQGGSSRLYLDIYKKKGLVHSISTSSYTPMDRGIFEVEALLDEDNIDGVINAVFKQIDLIKKQGVTFDELKKAKRQVLSSHIFSRQKASSLAYFYAVDEAFTGDYQFSQKYVEAIEGLDIKDVARVAKKYLIDSNLTIVVLRPESKEESDGVESLKTDQGKILDYTLDNGLRILLREDSTFPIVSIHLSLNGGLRQEPVEFNGISQLTASSWIKGTKRLSAKQIAQLTESLGIELGSFSGKNSFGINVDALSNDLPQAFSLLQELVKNPAFLDKEISKVKDSMKASIRRRDDDIFQSTVYVLKQTLFLKHPVRLEEEGTIESVDRITRDDVVSFYKSFAVPNNMVLSVFGDIDASEVLKSIKKEFGGLTRQEVMIKKYSEDVLDSLREKNHFMNKEQAMVMFGFHGSTIFDDSMYAMEVLTSILGSSFSGRLFERIREQLGQAYTLGGHFVPGPDFGMVYFYVLTSPAQVEKVKELVRVEIKRIQEEDVPLKELENVKMYLKGMFAAGQETNSSLSFMVGLDELYGLSFKRYQQYDQRIDAVTQENIKKLSRQYLDLEKMAIVVTQPPKNNF